MPKNPSYKLPLLGDTCLNCNYIVCGAVRAGQQTWSCLFYHRALDPTTPGPDYPTRLKTCDIDGKISQAKYRASKAALKESIMAPEKTGTTQMAPLNHDCPQNTNEPTANEE